MKCAWADCGKTPVRRLLMTRRHWETRIPYSCREYLMCEDHSTDLLIRDLVMVGWEIYADGPIR